MYRPFNFGNFGNFGGSNSFTQPQNTLPQRQQIQLPQISSFPQMQPQTEPNINSNMPQGNFQSQNDILNFLGAGNTPRVSPITEPQQQFSVQQGLDQLFNYLRSKVPGRF